MQSLNYAFEYGELSNPQKQAVITLVEKKEKDKRQIKNWRPISLIKCRCRNSVQDLGQAVGKCATRNNSLLSERLCQGENYF